MFVLSLENSITSPGAELLSRTACYASLFSYPHLPPLLVRAPGSDSRDSQDTQPSRLPLSFDRGCGPVLLGTFASSFHLSRHIVDATTRWFETEYRPYCLETPYRSAIITSNRSANNRGIHWKPWPTHINTTINTKGKNTWNRTSITTKSSIRTTRPRRDPHLPRTGKSQRSISHLHHAGQRIFDLSRQQWRGQVEVHTQQQAGMGRGLIPMPVWGQICLLI